MLKRRTRAWLQLEASGVCGKRRHHFVSDKPRPEACQRLQAVAFSMPSFRLQRPMPRNAYPEERPAQAAAELAMVGLPYCGDHAARLKAAILGPRLELHQRAVVFGG